MYTWFECAHFVFLLHLYHDGKLVSKHSFGSVVFHTIAFDCYMLGHSKCTLWVVGLHPSYIYCCMRTDSFLSFFFLSFYSAITAMVNAGLAQMGQTGWWNWCRKCIIANYLKVKMELCLVQKLLEVALVDQFVL